VKDEVVGISDTDTEEQVPGEKASRTRCGSSGLRFKSNEIAATRRPVNRKVRVKLLSAKRMVAAIMAEKYTMTEIREQGLCVGRAWIALA
jgi:hypothetical protein